MLNLKCWKIGKNITQNFETIRIRVKLSRNCLVSAYLIGLRTDTQVHHNIPTKSVRQCYILGRLYEKSNPRKSASNGWSTTKTVSSWNKKKDLFLSKMRMMFKDKALLYGKYKVMKVKNNLSNHINFWPQRKWMADKQKVCATFVMRNILRVIISSTKNSTLYDKSGICGRLWRRIYRNKRYCTN